MGAVPDPAILPRGRAVSDPLTGDKRTDSKGLAGPQPVSLQSVRLPRQEERARIEHNNKQKTFNQSGKDRAALWTNGRPHKNPLLRQAILRR